MDDQTVDDGTTSEASATTNASTTTDASSTTPTDEHHDWASNFCGIDTRASSDNGDATADASAHAAAPAQTAGSDPIQREAAGPDSTQSGGADLASGQASGLLASDPAAGPVPIQQEVSGGDPAGSPTSGGSAPGGAPAGEATNIDHNDQVWQQGYKDGFASPNTAVTTPAVYAPDAAAVYEDGVAAGQADANKPANPANTSNAAAPVFSNTNIQNIYVANSASAAPGQIAALKALDVGLSGPWKNLAWATIAASAAQRVFTPSIIDQKTLDVCASAAAVEAEAATNALGYAQEVCAVFSKGELGGTKVNTDLLAAKPVSGMDPCDWMMLSAAQDTSNLVRDFKGQAGEGKNQGGYGPQGTKSINDSFLLKSLDECVKTSKISCSFIGKEDDSKKVQALMAANGDKIVVLVENDGGMLANPTTGVVDGTGNPECHIAGNHSVRLISLSYGATVKFKIFTWGQEAELTWAKARYDSWVYGYMLGAKDASIDLP
jgi:hypothetical protein